MSTIYAMYVMRTCLSEILDNHIHIKHATMLLTGLVDPSLKGAAASYRE